MGKVFTTRARTRFTAATSRPFLIPTCAKRWFPSSGTIASRRALRSQRWARLSARTTPRTASSSIPTSSSAASRVRGLRCAELHGRHVRRQFLFQQSRRLPLERQRSLVLSTNRHLRHSHQHRYGSLGEQRAHVPPL